MKKSIVFLLLFICFNLSAQNKSDTSVYLCKYSFAWQKDTSKIFSKSFDLMYLEIGKSFSTFYSYHHLLGFQNFMEDVKERKNLDFITNNSSRYYKNSESEIIIHNFGTKEFKVIDRPGAHNAVTYCYLDPVVQPKWKLEEDTLTILNQLCQRATTTFKGRDYTAWFAPDIPISLGPWLFTGLPGLILRIHDSKNQISFDATEIGNSTAGHATDILYPNCLNVAKSKVQEQKKLKAENWRAFQKLQYPNLTTTYTNSAGEILQPSNKLKPYNPIDLSK
jgi:GLPGLI family protein